MSQQTGLVVARFRRHATVEDGLGNRHTCLITKRNLSPLVGDRVQWRLEPGGAVLDSIQPRCNALSRIDRRGKPETIAVNLSQLVVVAAPAPPADWFLVDRYLCAAELSTLKGVLVFNKTDLVDVLPKELQTYRGIGYPVRCTSARRRTGLAQLTAAMRGERSMMVGQSGAGKSSLINALLGDRVQQIGELTGKGGHGRHTTTTSVLYRLAEGGELIDSPGVRNFAPHIDDPARIAFGFREFRVHLGQCRFGDCRHLAEPGCAIKASVSAGEIDQRRYASYEALFELASSFLANGHR